MPAYREEIQPSPGWCEVLPQPGFEQGGGEPGMLLSKDLEGSGSEMLAEPD